MKNTKNIKKKVQDNLDYFAQRRSTEVFDDATMAQYTTAAALYLVAEQLRIANVMEASTLGFRAVDDEARAALEEY